MRKTSNENIKGLTLLEMGLVLICVSLLSVMFLFGRNLLEVSRVNNEISDLLSYKTSFSNFSEKYNCLPGDCINATTFIDENSCKSRIGGATCNGDGNGKYDTWTWANDAMRFWLHQGMTGFLKIGAYLDPTELKFRSSSYSKVAAHLVAYGNMALTGLGSSNYGNVPDVNVILFTGVFYGTPAYGPVLNPVNAESIDKKIDDGGPDTGAIMSYQANSPPELAAVGDCRGTLNGITIYNVGNEGLSCFMSMRLGD